MRPLLVIAKADNACLFLRLEFLIMGDVAVVITRHKMIVLTTIVETLLVSELMA